VLRTFISLELVEDAVGGFLRCHRVPQAVAGDDDEVLGAVHLDRGHVGVGAHVRFVVAVACVVGKGEFVKNCSTQSHISF
jgi:hypothetical protein